MKNKDTFIALIILFIVVFAIAIFYQYPAMTQLLPQGSHIWRQADCMAMTQNYQQFHLSFFKPAIYNLQSTNGNVAGEFPLFYYIAAQFRNVPFALRILHTIVFLSGIIACYFIAFYFLQRRLLAIFCAAFMLASPLLVFYGNNFLSDVPALSISFIAYAIFFPATKNNKSVTLYLAFFCFALAGLFKASYTLNFVLVFFYLLKLKKLNLKNLMAFCFILFPLAWYWYAKNYNAKNHDSYYFLSVYPIWKLSATQILLALKRIFLSYSKNYFWQPSIAILLFGFFFMVRNFKKLSVELRTIIRYSLIMVLIYILLFYEKMIIHEYYYVFFFIAVLFLLIGILKVYNTYQSENVFSHSALFIFILITIFFCKKIVLQKLKDSSYNTTLASIEFQDYILSKGITATNIVVSLPDISPNQTLFLLKRKGYTEYNNYLSILKEQKADFLILSNDVLKEDKKLQPYLNDSIGNFSGITLYKLK